jgi:hypothetical protein
VDRSVNALRTFVFVTATVLLLLSSLCAQRSLIASSYPGTDLGAQIMAADAALGNNPGTILINQPGQISTHIILSLGHGLKLNAPTTWLLAADLKGENIITCAGEKAAITTTLPQRNALFNAKDVQHISADGCWATATNPGGGGYYFFFGIRVGDVKVTHCHFQNISGLLAQMGGGAPGDGKIEANLSHDIVFADNTDEYNVKLPHSQFIGAMLVGVDRAEIRHNLLRGLTHGVMYWGGDSNRDIRDRYTPRWVRNVVIADNDCAEVAGSCYWGSMGQNIQYLRNHAHHCGDACLDIEGDVNDLVDGNTVIDGQLGILMRNWKLEYRNNTIESTDYREPLVHLSNNTGSGEDNLDLYMHDNIFRCTDPRTVCRIEYQAVQNFRFIHNTVTNGVIHPYDPHQMGTDVEDNTFTFDHTNSAPFAAIDPGWQVKGRSSRVINNTILSNAPQPPGSQCIRVVWADTGAPSQEFIQRNTCGGTHPFPIDLQMVSNGARTSSVTFHVGGNHFANNKIVREDNTHTATFDIQP